MLLDRSLISTIDTIESIARRYITQLQRVRPKGPYILGGYSFGGVVAYEMAQQLSAQSEFVEKLILFDTPNPAVEMQNRYTLAQRASANWRNSKEQPLIGRIGTLAKRVGTGIFSKRQHQSEVKAAMDQLQTGEEVQEEIRVIQVRETHTKIIEKYVPNVYAGTMVLFRSSRENDFCYFSEELGWEGLVKGGIELIDIPGKHLEIFEAPHLETLVAEFSQLMQR
jgi:thioesterase domain-containing protein